MVHISQYVTTLDEYHSNGPIYVQIPYILMNYIIFKAAIYLMNCNRLMFMQLINLSQALKLRSTQILCRVQVILLSTYYFPHVQQVLK